MMTCFYVCQGSEVRGGRADSYNVVVSDGYPRDPPAKIFLCNVTVHGTVYQLHGDDPKEGGSDGRFRNNVSKIKYIMN